MRYHSKCLILLPMAVSLNLCVGRATAASRNECLKAHESTFELDNANKLREELKQLLICGAENCAAAVRKECMKRYEEVEQAIPTVVFEALDGSGKRLINVKVTMDGELLTDHLDGTAVDVDPGNHDFVFETEGQPAIHKLAQISGARRGQQVSVTFKQLGVLAPAAAAVTAPPAPVATHASEVAPGPRNQVPASPAQPAQSPQRTIGWVALGVGGVALATSGVTGLMVISKKSSLDGSGVCADHTCSSSQRDSVSSYNSLRTVSTVALVAGVVVAGAGATLLLVSPGRSEHSLIATVGLGSLSLEQRF